LVNYYFDIETTGLNPFEHKILTIQLMKEGSQIAIWKLWEEEDEANLIAKFIYSLKQISKFDTIYGYNCLKFDVPFIMSRLACKQSMNCEKFQVLYNRDWKDLYQYLGCNYVSLDKWLRVFGIERGCSVTGADVPHLYRQRKFAGIEEHAREDVDLCQELVKKLRETRESRTLERVTEMTAFALTLEKEAEKMPDSVSRRLCIFYEGRFLKDSPACEQPLT